jgi:AraC family transcriptional regulator
MPAQRLAYIRVLAPYGQFERITGAYDRLHAWYAARGGRPDDTTLYGMSQDDPEITPPEQYRFDWGLRVPHDWAGEGEVSVVDLPALDVIYVHLQGDAFEEAKILQYLYHYWLPRSNYQPANWPAMEIYRRQPAELGWETFDLDCAVPVVPL